LSALSDYARVLIRPHLSQADEVGSAASTQKHGSVHREGVEEATAKPPRRSRRSETPAQQKDQETWVCTAQKSSFPPPKSKNHKKKTIRCNEIAFSFVLYHEGGYVINAADSMQ